MAFLFLIAGLILWLAGASWFTGAETVGIILTIVGSVGLFFQLAAGGTILHKIFKDF